MYGDKVTAHKNTQSSLAEKLLCRECESALNERYDQYGQSILRNDNKNAARHSGGVLFESIETNRFANFFISILWRMQVSGLEEHNQFSMEAIHEYTIWKYLNRKITIPANLYPVALSRLQDREKIFGNNPEHIRLVIMSPFSKRYRDCTGIRFAFSGFLVEIFIPDIFRFTTNEHCMLGMCPSDYFAPYLDIADDVQIITGLANAYEKAKMI